MTLSIWTNHSENTIIHFTLGASDRWLFIIQNDTSNAIPLETYEITEGQAQKLIKSRHLAQKQLL